MVTKFIWSDVAKEDLKEIYQNLLEYTKSEQNSRNVINDILLKVEEVKYSNQYQVDEILGEPFRRIIVRDFKIIYKVDKKEVIRIISIISTFKNYSIKQ